MQRHLTLPLLIVFVIIYILTIGTTFASSDAEVMYKTSRQIAFEKTIFLPENYDLPQIRSDEVGRWYAQYDPGLPLIAAPFVFFSDALAKNQLWNRYAFSAYLVVWISAIGAAGAVISVYGVARSFYGNRIALMVAIGAGLCSPLWVYGRLFFAEGLLAGLITGAFWAGYQKKWGWAGTLLAVAILTRAATGIYIIPVGWLLWRRLADGKDADPTGDIYRRDALQRVRRQGKKTTSDPADTLSGVPTGQFDKTQITRSIMSGHSMIKFGMPILLAIFGLLYHNHIRTGNFFQFGYGGQAFDTPPWIGIAGFLFSPGKSIFLYAPPLILSVIVWRRFHHRDRVLAEAILIGGALALVFYGSWWAWHGGWCWGARLLVPLMPIWFVPLGEVLSSATDQSNDPTPAPPRLQGGELLSREIIPSPLAGRARMGFWQYTLALLYFLGFWVTILGVFTDVNQTYAPYDSYDMVNYSLNASPLVMAIRMAGRGEIIALMALHLQDLGWVNTSAIAFPLILIGIGVGSAAVIIKEITRNGQ